MEDHKIEYLTQKPLVLLRGELPLAAVVRNEIIRISYFLAYYRAIGINRFFFIDNGSSDGTRELLLAQPDTYVFGTENSFAESQFGMVWINSLLDNFFDNRWLLTADADELFVWPDAGGPSLHTLTAKLDRQGARAYCALMLDMYSDKPFGSIRYQPGEDFRIYADFFDRAPYRTVRYSAFPHNLIYGGVRERIFRSMFGSNASGPTLSKVPLVRWRRGQRYTSATHTLGDSMPLAPARGALLHFKMLDDLREKCLIEINRKDPLANLEEHARLLRVLDALPSGSFYHPHLSLRLTDINQLQEIGLTSDEFAFGFRPRV